MIPKVIIDTDAGIDDAAAIFMALSAHKSKEINIIAITTVNGNTKLSHVNNNVLRILQTAHQLQIPVYSGADQGLVYNFSFTEEPFHGYDGFGDVTHDSESPSISIIKEEFAPLAIIRLIQDNPNEIILVGLGPLTNIAIVLSINPKCMEKLKDFYIMGGNLYGNGNITFMGEFNFFCDPEAAKVVLDRSTKVVKVAPWETCTDGVTITYDEREKLGLVGSASAKLLNLIETDILIRKNYGNYITCDQLAVAWMLDEWASNNKNCPLVTEVEELHATVELSGDHSRGLMVIDRRNLEPKVKNVLAMKKLNKEVYIEYLKMGFKL